MSIVSASHMTEYWKYLRNLEMQQSASTRRRVLPTRVAERTVHHSSFTNGRPAFLARKNPSPPHSGATVACTGLHSQHLAPAYE